MTRRERVKMLFLALGGIGDSVLTFATARRLRQVFPKDEIVALAMWPQSAELLKDLGIFDEVLHHQFQRAPLWRSLQLVGQLSRRRFDISIQAFPANRFEYNVVHWLIHARRRVGHEYLRGSSATYLRWLLTDRVAQTKGTHCIDENLKVLGVFGCRALEGPIDTSLGPLAPEYRAYAERMTLRWSGPLLGVHAGSSTYKNLHAKRWPPERFAELCRRALDEEGVTPLLFGSALDQEVNGAIQRQCPAARLVETPSIRHTAAMIQHCKVYVSNDSALAHVASALAVPTVIVTGPTDAMEVGPFAEGGCAVVSPLRCAPCFRVSRQPLRCQHPRRFACMKAIDVDTVLGRVRNVLRQGIGRRAMPGRGENTDDGTGDSLFRVPVRVLASLGVHRG